MFRDRSIPQEGGDRFSGVLLGARKTDATEPLPQDLPSLCKNHPKPYQSPVLLRRAMLFTTTLAYFAMISVLLMINSPKELVTNLSAKAPSLQGLTSLDDITAHFFSFYVLTILLCLCFRNAGYLVPIIFMVIYAGFTELFQGLLPARHSDIFDLLTNFTGIGCGVFSIWTTAFLQERHWLRQFHSGALVLPTSHSRFWNQDLKALSRLWPHRFLARWTLTPLTSSFSLIATGVKGALIGAHVRDHG